MAGNNLKTIVTADTSGFKKGMKDASKALKDFEKQGEGALTGIGSLFEGMNDTFGGLTRNIRNTSALFDKLFRDSTGGMSQMRAAIAGVGSALAGLGITAVIAAFRELNAEASNFEQRLQGVNLQAAAAAARDAYRQSLYDQTGRGEEAALTKEYWQTRMSMGWSNVTTGASKAEREEAMRVAEEAARLARERVDIQREIDQSMVSQAKMQARINELTNIARDNTKSEAERADARERATTLINIQYDKQIALQQRMADNWREANSLVSSTDEEMRAQYAAEAAVANLEGQRQSALRSLIRLNNSAANSSKEQATSAKETADATVLTLETATALVQRQRELAQIAQQNNAMMSVARFNLDGALPKGEGIQGQANAMVIPGIIKPEFDTQEWTDISNEVAGIIEDALTSVGDSVGQLIGDLATGGDAWGNFTNNAIQAFGDMAVTIGKMAVATGMATLGIKAALESLNPYVAIAAGTALIALGAAVRAGMSNVASGNYSTSVASSSYSSTGTYGQTSFGREMEVKVSGTLTANGSQLVAVLNNENDRKNYTT